MILASAQPTIVVTGGAGYIGSHTALLLSQKGYKVIVLDTFKHHQHVPHPFEMTTLTQLIHFDNLEEKNAGQISVLTADYADTHVLAEIFENNNVLAVIHCAALIEVGESVKFPRAYYNNNVIKTCTLLETMLDHQVKNIIFSSSCAVYGNPVEMPISETHPKNPISPYGKNKLIVEMMLEDFANAYDLHFIALRYFNAAGALPECGLGEQHQPESHLIPLLLHAAHENTPLTIFGNDYPTTDGTCVRDYIHVSDVAQAHYKALEYLNNGGTSDFFNLGTGHGFSVQEIIRAVEQTCNTKLNYTVTNRRQGDPALLIANPSKAHETLGWQPQHSDLNTIISSANTFYSNYLTTTYANKRARAVIE